MPRDPRVYITLHNGMPEHPKVDRLSDSAFRLLIDLWCWCSRNETDGKVPEATWRKRGTPRARAELLAASLAHPIPDGVLMHDYLEHQRSAAEIAELKAKRAKAGSAGGRSTASARTSRAREEANAVANAAPSAVAKRQQSCSKVAAETDTTTRAGSRSGLGSSSPTSSGDLKRQSLRLVEATSETVDACETAHG